MAKERADALVEFRADDVLEFTGLVVGFGVVDRKGVLKEALGKAVPANHVASTAASVVGQANLTVVS